MSGPSEPKRKARTTADDRLRRLLALVPWVVARGGADVDEVCARFGCTEQQLVEDLELLFVCGVAPFTPDALVEAWVDEGRVHIAYTDWFRRPLRLSAAQALVLLTAGQALLAVPGTEPGGPLARALAKVAQAAGAGEEGGGGMVDVGLGDADRDVLARLQEAAADGLQLELDYYSYGSDRRRRRVVDPWVTFSSGGAWYLRALDHDAGEPRLFRVDRVRDAVETGATFTPPTDPGPTTPYSRRDEDQVVTLDLRPGAALVPSAHPTDGAEPLPDGGVRVRIPVTSPGWLARLLVRLGPDATVVDDPAGVAAAAHEAAAKVLARYR